VLLGELAALQSTCPFLYFDHVFGKMRHIYIRKLCVKINCFSPAYEDDSSDCEFRRRNDRARLLRSSLKWINVQAKLLDICVAFHPLDLPPYVLLEIVDKFPFWSTHVNRKKKIDYIIQVKKFCDDLIENRTKKH
jgi:hypothetical protein